MGLTIPVIVHSNYCWSTYISYEVCSIQNCIFSITLYHLGFTNWSIKWYATGSFAQWQYCSTESRSDC